MTLFEMYIIVSSNKFWTGMISPAPAEIRIKIFKILKRIKILEILECMNPKSWNRFAPDVVSGVSKSKTNKQNDCFIQFD